MRSVRTLSRSICLVALTLGAGVARADGAPPDLCTSPGQPCQNAGPQYSGAGTCTMTTCTRSIYNPDGGARIPMSYGCNLCLAPDGGTPGAGGSAAGAGGSTTGAGGSTSKSSAGSSGCVVAGPGFGLTSPAVAIGLVALSLRRRRRRTGR